MILLITSLSNAHKCASALQESVDEATVVASNAAEAIAQLQAQEFSAVVIDQLLLQPLIMKRVTRVPVWASILAPIVLGIVIPFWGILLAPPLLAIVYAFRRPRPSP